MTTLDMLSDAYMAWQKQQGLDLGSADEHLHDEALTDLQRAWLKGFCARWEEENDKERDAENEERRLVQRERLLTARMHGMGFQEYNTGGGCMAWQKLLPDDRYIWICTTDQGLFEDADQPEWVLGVYFDTEDEVKNVHDETNITLQAALDSAQKIAETRIEIADVNPADLAALFVTNLRSYIHGAAWHEMKRLNSTETHPHVCHSHDFCDANEPMYAALISLVKRPVDVGDADVQALWNEAWRLAGPEVGRPA